jgi:hypothetical protein
MVNSPVIPDSELVNALNHSIAKSRFPGAYDAHKSEPPEHMRNKPALTWSNLVLRLSQKAEG